MTTIRIAAEDYLAVRREGGHRADHGRRQEADHPVPVHRATPRRVAAAGPLEAVRGRISEPSRKQQG